MSKTQNTKTRQARRSAKLTAGSSQNPFAILADFPDLCFGGALGIPAHEFIQFTSESGTLRINLDFATSRSPFQQTFLEKSLIEILPKYANEVTDINLVMMFKISHMDVSNKNSTRHQVLTNVVKELNKFKDLNSLRFTICIENYDFNQLKPASAIYGLKFTDWTFEVQEREKVTQIEIGSSLDRQLKALFRRGVDF